MAAPVRHFYMPNEASWDKILTLYTRTQTGYTKEDVNQHAWAALLRVYFPDHYPAGQVGGGTKYDVIVHPYRGIPLANNREHIPDVIVVRIVHVIQPPAPIQISKRDLLWVECKAPSADMPSTWKNVMNEAVGRLQVAHAARPLYLILNVGLQWMIFWWNPNNPAPPAQRLRIVDARGTSHWDVDPRVHPPTSGNIQFNQNTPPLYIDQNHVIHTNQAVTLDCFTMAPGNPPTVLAHQTDLNFLETCIQTIFNTAAAGVLVGQNDPSFE